MVVLNDRLSPDVVSMLWMKGQVFHRARAHLKVPGWSSIFIELLNLGSSTSLPGPLSSFLEGGRQRTQEKRKEEILQNNRKQSQ